MTANLFCCLRKIRSLNVKHTKPYYLSNRKQCVKVGTSISKWQDIYKGVPQGSILGPVLFNVFLYDIFHFVTDSDLYNYADDNTVSYADHDIDKVVDILEKDSLKLIDWFSINQMEANPDKFQAMAIGAKTMSKNITMYFQFSRQHL